MHLALHYPLRSRRLGQAEPAINYTCPKYDPGPLTTCSFLKPPARRCRQSLTLCHPGGSVTSSWQESEKPGQTAQRVYSERGEEEKHRRNKSTVKRQLVIVERALGVRDGQRHCWTTSIGLSIITQQHRPRWSFSAQHTPCSQPCQQCCPSPAPAGENVGRDRDPAVSPLQRRGALLFPPEMWLFLRSVEANEDKIPKEQQKRQEQAQ